jgi:hypothetical protein
MSITEEAKPDRMAAARAAKAARRVEVEPETRPVHREVPGQKLSIAAREKCEELAALIPTTPDEYRLQANAAMRLKLANPGVLVRLVATRSGKYQQVVTAGHGNYRVETRHTEPSSMMISGDDLARVAPGGIGLKLRIGETALLTPDAADRLIAQGFVEPA